MLITLAKCAAKALRETRDSYARSRFLLEGAETARKLVEENREIFLEIGSGEKKGVNGWTTLDICGESDIYWDLLRPLPFPDDSVRKIYSSHLLEHFHYPDIMKILAECHRVLEPGGLFSISVPDASLYIRGYLGTDEFMPAEVYEPAYHFHSKIDLVNYIAYMNGHHKFMFDRDNLTAILETAGFKGVHSRSFDPEIDCEDRDWESIYAEGIKG